MNKAIEVIKQQAAAAVVLAEFLTYTEVYEKAKQAGREQAAAEAIEAKSKLNAGAAEHAARKAGMAAAADIVAAAAAAALPAMLQEAEQAEEAAGNEFELSSIQVIRAKKQYKEAEAGSEEEAAAAAALFAGYMEKMQFKLKLNAAVAKKIAIAEAIAANK